MCSLLPDKLSTEDHSLDIDNMYFLYLFNVIHFVSSYHRQRLFHQHPLIPNLSGVLLHVFVSIEMTGQGVEFEQKFNYRRPMYAILEYLWEIEIHRDAIKVRCHF